MKFRLGKSPYTPGLNQPFQYLIVEPVQNTIDLIMLRSAHESTEPQFELHLDLAELRRLQKALAKAEAYLAKGEVKQASIQARFGNWLGEEEK